MSVARGERGVVLVVVLFFALLLAGTVATFQSRALIDHMIVQNRDSRARAEALARGGVRLATALLLEDKFQERQTNLAIDHGQELWARVSGQQIAFEDGSTLDVAITDVGAKLNLNAVMIFDDTGAAEPKSSDLLLRLIEKAIDEIPLPPGEKHYDAGELAANLIDYVDEDELKQRGGPEDDDYQRRDPPGRPANRPLLSVAELRRVEGFDAKLVESLEPYVTVYPYVGGGGINPNTAPPWVLSLLFFDDEVDLRLADEDTVRRLLLAREDGGLVCGEEQSAEGCTPIRDIVTNAIFPEPDYTSDVFVITATGRVGDVTRRIEAVLDRGDGAEPRLLSWRAL
jgi:general secretion pathway protein K